jgi:ubiquinone/menaquinone biosynthesis C-methylase UbiE
MSQLQKSPARNAAQTYEEFYVANKFRHWAGDLLNRVQPRPGDRILDLACGTGIVARLVAQRLKGQAQVAGLDLNPAMIEVARQMAAREGVEIEWHVGSADQLPFPEGSFDLLLSQQGLQFFPDRAAAAAEIHRVLVPGGRVATATWTAIENNPLSQIMAEVVAHRTGGSAMELPFALGNREELRAIFTGAGFVDVEIEVVRRTVRFPDPDHFLDGFVTSRTAGIAALQAMNDTDRATLIAEVSADMAEPLRRYIVGNEVVYPTEAHIAIARKRVERE